MKIRSIHITKGHPSLQDWHRIIDMISEGYTSGVDLPPDVNWKVYDR